MFTFTQLSTPVTEDEALETLIGWLSGVGFNATSWQSGSTQLNFLTMFAKGYARFTSMVAILVTAGFNETAEDEWLTRFSRSNYVNERVASVAARHLIQFTCADNAGPYSPTVGKIVVTDGTRTFRLVDDDDYPIVTIPSGGSVSMVCEAEVAGSAANAALGTITRMVTTYVGVTCTNTSTLTAGVDTETDDTLRARNRTKWANLSIEVTASGCRQLALEASSAVKKVYVDDTNPRGAGTVDVYVFADVKSVGSDDLDAVQAALDLRFLANAVGTTPRAQASYAPEYALATGGTVYCEAGKTATAQAAVEAALTALVQACPLGGYDYSPGPSHVLALNDIVQAIEGADGVALCVLTAPTGNLTIPDFAGIVPPSDWGFTYQEVTS